MNNDDVLAALATVQDPELQRSVVDLGMVRDIEIADDRLVGAPRAHHRRLPSEGRASRPRPTRP